MNDEKLVEKFRALADPTRMRIFRMLVCCCDAMGLDETGGVSRTSGPTAGEVCCQITGATKINSTISHHLKELKRAGLITVERYGRRMICRANPAGVREMMGFLMGVEDGSLP